MFVYVKKRGSKEYYKTLIRKHHMMMITLSDKQLEEVLERRDKARWSN